ncbi:MAG TPA: DUF2269 family protein [Candidatus Rubrimentiphilum sp.]|nr:DUF2269 family protein [Candidatus Rubrimentiphilum sp.]
MYSAYLLLKLVHVIAVVAFLGTISTGLFWKVIADRTGRPDIAAHTLRGIILSDRFITIPSIVVILIAGFGAASISGWTILGTGWILWSLVLFIIAGVAFVPVSRAQRELAELASAGTALSSEAYRNLSRRWETWGAVALITPLLALVLMVTKPALAAFHR